jgi:hypothetical protein
MLSPVSQISANSMRFSKDSGHINQDDESAPDSLLIWFRLQQHDTCASCAKVTRNHSGRDHSSTKFSLPGAGRFLEALIYLTIIQCFSEGQRSHGEGNSPVTVRDTRSPFRPPAITSIQYRTPFSSAVARSKGQPPTFDAVLSIANAIGGAVNVSPSA